ncbi:LuxR C-terminal-related transcriptional regulator [Ekhidna sp. MALMAid0563]|uniref:helix-turn-helix transcriptional regulator n=1 Tax=Ekhidna sp. MALMAid0563 TaxID=3143937 RepID=UPI0032DFAC72
MQEKEQVLSFWKQFSDEGNDPVTTPDLSVLDQIAGYFSPGSYYYYLMNFPKFKMEMVSHEYEQFTGLSNKTYSVAQWLEPVHPDDVAHVQSCEKVAGEFLFDFLSPSEITSYKISYCYRMKTVSGAYRNILHQAVALNLTPKQSIGHVLGIEADIEHIASIPKNTISFIHLSGGESFLNVSTSNPSFIADKDAHLKITQQETNILRLVSYGLSNHEIAERLSISAHTVKTHRANILKKEDKPTMTAIISDYIRKGII